MHCTREPTGNRDYRGNQEPALQLIVQEVAAQVSSLNLSGQEVSVCLVGLDIAILCSGGCSFLVSRRLQLPRLEVSAPWVGVCRSQFRGLKLKAKMFELLVKKLYVPFQEVVSGCCCQVLEALWVIRGGTWDQIPANMGDTKYTMQIYRKLSKSKI